MMVLILIIVAVSVALDMVTAQSSTMPELDLTPLTSEKFGDFVNCTTKFGKAGQCVNERFCNEDMVILPGGDIGDIDLREKSMCIGELDWCCSTELLNTPTKVAVSPTDRCLATADEESSWTVGLFISHPEQQQAARFIGAGVLISSRVVLTAATCLLSARNNTLYVQVPASPGMKKYTVQYRIGHTDYNSGTHIHDFGILVLDKDVEWGGGKSKSACLDFTTKLQGDCMATGFTNDFEIITTLLTVEKGSCPSQPDSGDVCCGTNVNELDSCIITTGSPVLCLSRDNVLTVVGVSRSICRNNLNVLVGELSSVKTWLQRELEKINLSQSAYTYTKL